MRLELGAQDRPPLGNCQPVAGGVEDLFSGGTDASLLAIGGPLMLPVEDIDEDPLQPRTEFDADALRELADSILQCGVLQAISVRPHPERPSRWLVNLGARRLRACRLAGRSVIPAFVDAAQDTYAQVMENEQRENLTPLDLAMFIQRRLALAESQSDIARKLGKSRAYVTYAMALIDAPDWLMAAYRQGRCRGAQELYALRNLCRDHPQVGESLLADTNPITRARLDDAKALILAPCLASSPTQANGSDGPGVSAPAMSTRQPVTQSERGRAPGFAARASYRVQAEFDGAVVDLVTDKSTGTEGHFFIIVPGNAAPQLAQASRLRLLRIIGA